MHWTDGTPGPLHFDDVPLLVMISTERRRTGKQVLFLNRSYWPDAEATGQLLTELCEDLSRQFNVSVVVGQPNKNPSGVRFRRVGTQVKHDVKICRVWNSRFPKSSLPGKAVNLLTYLATATVAVLTAARPDIVVVETDPPLLCFLGRFLQKWRGAKLVVYLQDIYPDLAVAIGKLPNGFLTRWLRSAMFRIYRQADRVVVLSRDMRELLIESGVSAEKVVRIPNWVDCSKIAPRKKDNPLRKRWKTDEKFLVMYSGNMGLCQRLEDVIDAARLLRDRSDILFLLIGEGANKQSLQRRVALQALTNVTFLPYQPKEKLAESLSAADLHLVPLDPRITSYLMPSKLYGILASGTPLVAVTPETCELAQVVRDEGVGYVAAPEDPMNLADLIRQCADDSGALEAMGLRARRLALKCYDRAEVTGRFAVMLSNLVAPQDTSIAYPEHRSIPTDLADSPSTQPETSLT